MTCRSVKVFVKEISTEHLEFLTCALHFTMNPINSITNRPFIRHDLCILLNGMESCAPDGGSGEQVTEILSLESPTPGRLLQPARDCRVITLNHT